MDRLKSLLNIETIAAKADINGELENIAKILMNEYYISNGTHLYRPLEIEFYIYLKDISKSEKRHADEHVYPRTAETGRIFFHQSGMDICFTSQAVWKTATLVVSLYVLLNERMVRTSVVRAYALMRP